MIKDLFAHIKRKKEKIALEKMMIEMMEEKIVKLANEKLRDNRTLIKEHLNTKENMEKYINSAIDKFGKGCKVENLHTAQIFGMDRIQTSESFSFEINGGKYYVIVPIQIDKIFRMEGCEDDFERIKYGTMYKGVCCDEQKASTLNDVLFNIMRTVK